MNHFLQEESVVEMMIISVFFVLLGSAVSWYAAASGERKRHEQALSAAKSKLLSAQGQTARFRSESSRLQEEISVLQKRIDAQIRAGSRQVARVERRMTGKIIRTGSLCVAAGLFAGSLVTGLVAGSRAEVRLLRQTVDLQVQARVAEERAEMLAAELHDLRQEYRLFRRDLMHTREARAVASAKLQLLLDHLAHGKKGDAFALDIKAMRDSLKRGDEFSGMSVPEMVSLAGSPV